MSNGETDLQALRPGAKCLVLLSESLCRDGEYRGLNHGLRLVCVVGAGVPPLFHGKTRAIFP